MTTDFGKCYRASGGAGASSAPPKVHKVPPAFTIPYVQRASPGEMGSGSGLSADCKPNEGSDPECTTTWTPEGNDKGTFELDCIVNGGKAVVSAKVTCDATRLCVSTLVP